MNITQSSLPIIIVGNGIAGVTLARHLRKQSDQEILIISKESPYFFSRTALMYVFMGHLKWEHLFPYENNFWKKNKLDLLQQEVGSIDTKNREVVLTNTQRLPYDKLILATGSLPNRFGWKGQELEGVQGLYSKQDLERLEACSKWIKNAVIVGGGLIGVELAEMLHSRKIKVTFLVREDSFWNNVLPKGESVLISQHLKEYGIDLRFSTNLVEIHGDENGRAKAVVTDKGEIISCQFVGLTAGVRPNIDFIKETELDYNRGILVDDFLATNLPDIYAIGDCAELRNPQPHRRAIEAVWYAGRMMGETLAKTLTNTPTPYRPGHWFNSAKFFDIEYQTYGQVNPLATEKEAHFYWEYAKKKCAVNFAYQPKTMRFLGINTLGIRMRHHTFDQWLSEKVSIDYVINQLDQALFDPEFYTNYTSKIQASWHQQAH